ncbi:protein of unknown function [Nitrospira japonica]|uniref:Uncharacterized protein n=1 Tax=Nitrospira japonica TaxID=1325564 RepID=A0A1W1I0M8_9BACT|nr:hypothetical protein [Nitrospira japonica]SLM46558.1 protein of unknown function [Nitrospira japonica]
MKTVIHQGYTIKSFPQHGRTFNEWTISLEIFWRHKGTTRTRSFTADLPYGSEEEADLHGISYAQRIIDGNVPGLSVNETHASPLTCHN